MSWRAGRTAEEARRQAGEQAVLVGELMLQRAGDVQDKKTDDDDSGAGDESDAGDDGG